MANFTTKTIKEIYDGFIAKYTILRTKNGDNSPILSKAAIKSLGYAIAGVCGELWQLAVWIYKQCFPQTCGLPALKFWGNLIGVDYKNGETANLSVNLTDVNAQYLPAGVVYKELNSGLIFKTASQVATVEGEITATVVCTSPGAVGNLATGTTLNIANPIDGIPSTATVTAVTIEGTEDEKLEEYRKRVLYKFRNKSQSGSPLDYYTWTMEVSGIVDALPYVLEEGTVTVYPIAEGSGKNRTPGGSLTPNPFPVWNEGQFTELSGSGQMLAIANSIEGSEPGVHDRRPATAKVDLKTPNYTAFTIEIDGLTDTSFNDSIRDVLISTLDKKRPQLVVLNYPASNAKINRGQLSGAVTEIIGEETFTSFLLKNSEGSTIEETTLGIGCLAYLDVLKINNEVVYDSSDDDVETLEEGNDENNSSNT